MNYTRWVSNQKNRLEITVSKLKDKNLTKKLLISELWMTPGQRCDATETFIHVKTHQTRQRPLESSSHLFISSLERQEITKYTTWWQMVTSRQWCWTSFLGDERLYRFYNHLFWNVKCAVRSVYLGEIVVFYKTCK